jgi:hypothetical protein
MGRAKSRIAINVVLTTVAVVLLFICYTLLTLNFSYSKGARLGYIQKFAQKGKLCKTWEGEMLVLPLPGEAPQRFQFSVRNEAVAADINKAMGQKVLLRYSNHFGVPTCYGETWHFAEEVRLSP